MSKKEEVIVIDDSLSDHLSDSSSDDSRLSDDEAAAHQEVITIASSSSSDDNVSSLEQNENVNNKHRRKRDAPSFAKMPTNRKKVIEIDLSSSSERKRSRAPSFAKRPINNKKVIEIDLSSSDSDESRDGESYVSSEDGGKKKSAKSGTSPGTINSGTSPTAPQVGGKRKCAVPKRFDSDEENSSFRRCPICLAMVPKFAIEYHADVCGEDHDVAPASASAPVARMPTEATLSSSDDSDSDNKILSTKKRRNAIQRKEIIKIPDRHFVSPKKQNASPSHDFSSPHQQQIRSPLKQQQQAQSPHQQTLRLKDPTNDENARIYSARLKRNSGKNDRNNTASSKPKSNSPHDEAHQAYMRGGAKRKFSTDLDTLLPSDLNSEWRKAVEDALRTIRRETAKRKAERLEQVLKAKNNMMRHRQQQLQARQTNVEYPLLDKVAGKRITPPKGDVQEEFPREMFTTVFLKKHFGSLNDDKTDSAEEGEEKDEDASSDESCTSVAKASIDAPKDEGTPVRDFLDAKVQEFHNPDQIGVGYEEREIDEEIDRVLTALHPLNYDQDKVNEYLALLLQESIARVQTRYEKVIEKRRPEKDQRPPYEDMMSSFRDLFCRRCFSYDCHLHGLAEKFCPILQAELAIQKEMRNEWEEESPVICQPVVGQQKLASPPKKVWKPPPPPDIDPQLELSDLQKVLCKRLYHIFNEDLEKVASAIGIPQQSIMKQVPLEPFHFSSVDPYAVDRSKQRSNAYNPQWLKGIVDNELHPFFFPCHHTGPCTEEVCTCIKHGFFCTKHCIWGSSSRNFFRGCNCTAKCNSKACPCFASNRECDPDLCKKCGVCKDPPNKPISQQSCRNDSIGMRRHTHLLLAKSEVAGWGLFTKNGLKKGDYVHEYLGEVISHEEAEKRGAIYDERNQTYLFDLSTDYAVDALYKGNKTRFINHSNTPNLVTRMCVVNGDSRIGFFAKVDIEPQSELFFDYGKMFNSNIKSKFVEKGS